MTRRAIIWFLVAIGVLMLVGVHARLLLPVSSPVIVATSSLRAGVMPVVDGESRRGGLLLLEAALDSVGATTGSKQKVLLFDAGNSLYADLSSPDVLEEFPRILEDLGYDAITIGYRDFEVLKRLQSPIQIPIVACNIRGLLGKQSYTASKDFRSRDVTIRVIGIVDPTTPTIQDANDLSGIVVQNLEESLDTVKRELTRQPVARVNIVLSSAIDARINRVLAEKLRNVSLIIGIADGVRGGISHNGSTFIATPQSEGQSMLVAAFADSTGDQRSVVLRPKMVDVVSDGLRPRQRYRSRLRSHWLGRKMQAEAPHVVGSVSTPEGIRLKVENPVAFPYPYWSYFNAPMYALIADAIRAEFPVWEQETQHGTRLSRVDVVFVNTGSVERGLPSGIVMSGDLKAAIPFDNKLVAYRMTGKQISGILSSKGMRDHGILGVSGLEYEWDYGTGKPVDNSVVVIKAGRNAPIEPTEHYRVVINDFLATGGDDYLKCPGCESIVEAALRQDLTSPRYPPTTLIVERYLLKNSPIRASVDRRARFVR